MAIGGSCLCGDVTFTSEGPWLAMYHCHCSMCRKAHGAPYATYLAAARGSVTVRGEASIGRYVSSPGNERASCKRCGSIVPPALAGDFDLVPAGLLDDDPGIR